MNVRVDAATQPNAAGASLEPTRLVRELHPFAWIYFGLSFLLLRSKVRATPAWLDGTLDHNHPALLAFKYVQNEQSRVLQFYIPEALIRLFGLSIVHAYLVQRFVFVGLSFVLFHLYLRRWFSRPLAFAAVALVAAILPFSFYNDLQESSAFMMASSVALLWIIRDGSSLAVALALIVAVLNNETSLAFASVYFGSRFRGWRLSQLWTTTRQTLAIALPAFAYSAWIRWYTWDAPHLGGARHWRDNAGGMLGAIRSNPLDYYQALYLSIFFIFNVLWLFAVLRLRDKPRFVRATLLLIPAFVIPHMITGIILEVRQMVPLGFVVIPAAFFWIFRGEPAIAAGADRL